MIRTKIRLDIDPRDLDKVNEMAKTVVNSGKWKHTSSQFLQRDMKTGKTWAEKNPEMVSKLYSDVVDKLKTTKKGPKKPEGPTLKSLFGEPSLKKQAFDYKKMTQMRSTLDNLRAKVRHLENMDELDKDKAISLVGQIRGKKHYYKKFVQDNKDWDTLNNFKDMEQRVIKLRREAEKVNPNVKKKRP